MSTNENAELIPYDQPTMNGEIVPAPPPAETPGLAPILDRYVGIASGPFTDEVVKILMAPVATDDIEIRPDGLIYLPEIKYRRILNRAFGPGAWSLLPININIDKQANMLYYKGALFVYGRFVSEAIGEQQYFPENDRMSYATAAESAKSNCLMRCCKDLGIASELWDPTFIARWKAENAVEVWVQNVGKGQGSGSKKKMWRKRTSPPIDMWPWKEEAGGYDRRSDAKPDAVTIEKPRFREGLEQSIGAEREAPVEAPRERQTYETPPTRSPAIITFKQAKRFGAIARDNGWTKEDIEGLLTREGFVSAEEITRNAYDRLCGIVEMPPER